MGEMGNAYKVLVGKPEGKRPLGRRRHRWEDNSKTNLGETGHEGVDWIQLAHDEDQWWEIIVTIYVDLHANFQL
jgi:hypothetical protein